jgi:hypothetical protein
MAETNEQILAEYNKAKKEFDMLEKMAYKVKVNDVDKYCKGLKCDNMNYRIGTVEGYFEMPKFTYEGKAFEISCECKLGSINNFDDDQIGTETKTVIILHYAEKNILLYSDRNHHGYNLFSDALMVYSYKDIEDFKDLYLSKIEKQEIFANMVKYEEEIQQFTEYLNGRGNETKENLLYTEVEELLLRLFIHIHICMCNGLNYFKGIELDKFLEL